MASLSLSAIAVMLGVGAIALVVDDRGRPAVVAPAPTMPTGVCVDTLTYPGEVDAAESMVRTVQQPVLSGGVLTCTVGTFVPVMPR